ncbi:MAG: NAD-binding protein [Anaerolineales bacterium]|jgi:trk system potassium uptake protein TrkA|nr:NAD-binding protein [Anaerolineales bacterium]
MKVIIMGCGRVGEQVSVLMSEEGHEVVVIDQDGEALARLGPGFRGKRIKGIGFDRDILLSAGIEQADAFAATSSSDTANIIAARIARNVFHVPRVVARLFDPRKAEIYRRLGLMTISSTTWGAERIHELIMHSELDPVRSFGNGDVHLLEIEAPYHLVGRMIKDLSIAGEISVVAVTRQGRAFLPMLGTELRAGDLLHLVVLASAMHRLEDLLG